ncbi:MAG: hypothetical protein IPP74_09140 [Alphaproteobacteria bacterium]|nr:hypothetical protein [Alphaproteobacteria bacterium]
MDVSLFLNFFYKHPAYAWAFCGTLLVFLGLVIQTFRVWFMSPGVACLITSGLMFIGLVSAGSLLIQVLCTLGFLVIIIACYE